MTDQLNNITAEFVKKAKLIIDMDSPKIKSYNPIGVQNRLIDVATMLYMRSSNLVSIVPGFKAPAEYRVPDLALCEDRANHYGVAVGSPTGKMVFDYKGTGLSSLQAQALMVSIQAGAKKVFRRALRQAAH